MSSSPRRRVLGLVIVVPRLTCRVCPRRNGAAVGEGDALALAGLVLPRVGGTVVSSLRSACMTLAEANEAAAAGSGSVGVTGIEDEPDDDEDMSAFPSSDAASMSSGGKRSFSMSDLRLQTGRQ